MAMSFLGLEAGKVCGGPRVDDELGDIGTIALMIESLVPLPKQDGIDDRGVIGTAKA